MPKDAVYIIDATTISNMKAAAAATNDIRFLDALVAPGQMIITSTVRAEAAGNIKYNADVLADRWISRQIALGRLTEIETLDKYPILPGVKNQGGESIRYIVPLYSSLDTYVITDDINLTQNPGGAATVLSTNRYMLENLFNGSITTSEYANGVAAQLGNRMILGLVAPETEYNGTNGVKFSYDISGATVRDRNGAEYHFGLKERFRIDDASGTVRKIDLPIQRCFMAGTNIMMMDLRQKNIENINVGDIVSCFDQTENFGLGTIKQAKVSRLFRNTTQTVINLRNVYCTPGHIFLTYDGLKCETKCFSPIGNILHDDRIIVEHDATIIRARTGAKIGQADDALVSVVYRDPPVAGQQSPERHALVRAGIPLPPVMTKDTLAPAQSLAQHLADHGITPLADGRLRTPDGTIHDACNWPEGTTPFDTHEARNWIVQADGVPYCPPWIRDLVAVDETEGLRVVGALSA